MFPPQIHWSQLFQGLGSFSLSGLAFCWCKSLEISDVAPFYAREDRVVPVELNHVEQPSIKSQETYVPCWDTAMPSPGTIAAKREARFMYASKCCRVILKQFAGGNVVATVHQHCLCSCKWLIYNPIRPDRAG